jgi:hypothetical protein
VGCMGRGFLCFYLNPPFVLNTHLCSIMNVTWTAYSYGLEMAYPASNAENALQKVLATSNLLPLCIG